MLYTYKHNGITWIDLENPTREEVRSLVEQFGIAPIVADELLAPTARSRADLHGDYIYLILHFPQRITDHHVADIKPNKLDQEIDFVIAKDFIITTRYGAVDSFLEFAKMFETNSILDRSNMAQHAGYIFYYMIRNIYKTLFEEVQNVKDMLTEDEEKIFSGKEREMVAELSKINRLLLYYKDSLSFHREVLNSFEVAGREIFEPEFSYYLRAVTGEYYKVQGALESSRDYLGELRRTNDSLLSSKQNEVMKMIAIISFITFPMTLIAGIFGMNTINTPLLGETNDFWIVVGIMVIMATIILIFFKKKDWI
jgi:magnesium transporter